MIDLPQPVRDPHNSEQWKRLLPLAGSQPRRSRGWKPLPGSTLRLRLQLRLRPWHCVTAPPCDRWRFITGRRSACRHTAAGSSNKSRATVSRAVWLVNVRGFQGPEPEVVTRTFRAKHKSSQELFCVSYSVRVFDQTTCLQDAWLHMWTASQQRLIECLLIFKIKMNTVKVNQQNAFSIGIVPNAGMEIQPSPIYYTHTYIY